MDDTAQKAAGTVSEPTSTGSATGITGSGMNGQVNDQAPTTSIAPPVVPPPAPEPPVAPPPVPPPVIPEPAIKPEAATAPKQKEYPPFAPPVQVSDHEVHDSAKADQVAKEEGDEYWEKFAREIELEKEIAEMGGVEKVESGEVKIPKELADQMGIKASVTIDTPIAKLPTDFSVRGVTLDDTQLSAGEKKPTSSAFRWLAEWFILQLKKARFIIKSVKGKIIRSKV